MNRRQAVDVSVVLPVFHQAAQLEDIVARARIALSTVARRPEILLVANGGDDDDATLAAARRLAAEDETIRVIESPPGWGAAVRTGLAASRGTIVAYTNSARTQAADLQLALRYGAINDRAVVKASRKERRQFLRRLGSVIYNFECRMMFGLALWDINGTPKVLHRDVLEQLHLTEDGDLIDLELAILCKEQRIPVVEMPVYNTQRISGRATTNLRSALRLYARPFVLRRRFTHRVAPLRAGERAA